MNLILSHILTFILGLGAGIASKYIAGRLLEKSKKADENKEKLKLYKSKKPLSTMPKKNWSKKCVMTWLILKCNHVESF